jgi:peptide/nickel transport system substrate-binding protein
VSVTEALRLENKTREDNQKITSALGRLPENDHEVDWEAPIFRHYTGDVKSTNPIMGSSAIEFDVTGMTGFGLFGFDWDFKPFAAKDTVVSWQTSKDRLYDKVVMRDDLTWSDGRPITAQDVVFSFQVIMSDQVPVPAVRSGTDKIRWIEAYDDHTLVFFHKEALATNVWNLNFPVIPKHIYEKSISDDPTLQNSAYHVQQENNPVCGGPYTITSRTRGQEIVLQRRESWYMHNGKQVRAKPYFKRIRYRIIQDPGVALLALKKGDVEEMLLNPEQWTTQTNGPDFYNKNTKAYGVEWTGFHFCWNLKTPFFSDVRVRKAMSWAFDYREMLNHLLYGLYEPSTGIFYPGSRWAPRNPPAPYHQDLDRAEKLLDEAGWSDHDGDGIRDKTIGGRKLNFEFNLLVANVPLSISIGSLLKENLDRIGVICNVRPLEYTVLQDNEQNHKFEAAFGGWSTGTDPDTTENIFGTGQGRNFGEYSNPEVDRLYEQGRKEFDPQKREAIYGRIAEILWNDQPYTWLYTRNAFYGFNKRLRGYNFSPRGPYNYGPGFGSIWKVRIGLE